MTEKAVLSRSWYTQDAAAEEEPPPPPPPYSLTDENRARKAPVPAQVERKVVLVGDCGVGKTALCARAASMYYGEASSDRMMRSLKIALHRVIVELKLCETHADGDHDRLIRPLLYPDTHVILICFSLAAAREPVEENVENWLSEVLHFCPRSDIMLVGLQQDRRDSDATFAAADLPRWGERAFTPRHGELLRRKTGACRYLECSAVTGEGVREVFECAGRLAHRSKVKRPRCRGCVVF